MFTVRVVIAVCVMFATMRAYSEYQRKQWCDRSSLSSSASSPAHEWGRTNGVLVLGDEVPWCTQPSLLAPQFYGSIQQRYWSVEVIGYWTIRKLPLFLLTAPTLIATLYVVYRTACRLVGMGSLSSLVRVRGDTFAFAVHALVLLIPAVTVYNVEVFTRIIFSASPFLCIELARCINERTPNVRVEELRSPSLLPFLSYLMYRRDMCNLIAMYFVGFAVLGTLSHAAFLPFT